MREVKFRIWDGIKLIYQDDINYIDFRSGFASVFDEYNYVDNCSKGIDIDNIMQYTGLKDIEGKEIYEGDIVEKEFVDFSNRDKFIGIIKFIDGCWCVENENKRRAYFLFNETDINSVIGNIYENPELLNKI